MTRRLRLTEAQTSALECRHFDLADPAEAELLEAWDQASETLTVTDANREALFEALNEASNAEDAGSQEAEDPQERRWAARSARSLSALASRVLRAGRQG